ncbi:MAG: hypothetical protein AAF648_15485 [Pseudomonadota bacterium]
MPTHDDSVAPHTQRAGWSATLAALALGGCADGAPPTAADVVTADPPPAAESQRLSYADRWGPTVGTALPLLAANDHTGAARTLDDLAGKNGLLLYFNRSADW